MASGSGEPEGNGAEATRFPFPLPKANVGEQKAKVKIKLALLTFFFLPPISYPSFPSCDRNSTNRWPPPLHCIQSDYRQRQTKFGDHIHRAVIGFGAGESKMNLYITMNGLAYPEQPLYSSAESGDSGKEPGAAITMNPYVAATSL